MRWIITGEIVVAAILVVLIEWRWGIIAWLLALGFPALLIATALWRRRHLANALAVLGGLLVVLAVIVAMAYYARLQEQAQTVRAMKRVAADLAKQAALRRGLYPDGAHFEEVVRSADRGASLNDAWGHPFRYTAIDRIGLPTGLGAGPGFILQSTGADGIPKPNYIGDVYNWPRTVLGLRDCGNDLLMINGVFVQGPRSAWE